MEKVEVDAKGRNFRVNKKFLGFKITGIWRYIPDYEYISVFSKKIRSTFFSRGGERTMYTYEHQINGVKDDDVILIYEAKSEEQAKSIAKELARKLGEERLWDATQKPPQWVNL